MLGFSWLQVWSSSQSRLPITGSSRYDLSTLVMPPSLESCPPAHLLLKLAASYPQLTLELPMRPPATSACQISSPKPNTISCVCACTSCPMHTEVKGQLAGVGSLFPPRGSGNQTWVIGFVHKHLSPLLSLALLLFFFFSSPWLFICVEYCSR